MAFPKFYQPGRVGTLFIPDTKTAISEGQAAGVKPSAEDSRRVILVLVDCQVDFVHEDGALYVPGAIEDMRRTIDWLFRNIEHVTAIAASLDTHIPLQIFYPTWWADEKGNPPEPYTVIKSEDVQQGRWRPLKEPQWSVEYVEKLEEQAKKELMIWPYHTMLGTPGHALTPALYEAIAYHSGARNAQPIFISKGQIAQSEYYSMLEPEVKVPDHPQGTLNSDFLNILMNYDRIYIAGEAKSHCVLETVQSMLRHFKAEQPEVINRTRILVDCTSPVAHPEIDFAAIADEAYAGFEQQGVKMVRSTDPLD